MAKYFNRSSAAQTVTFSKDRVVRFASQSWSEDIPRDDEGHPALLRLVRKNVLFRDPMAGVPVTNPGEAPAGTAPVVLKGE